MTDPTLAAYLAVADDHAEAIAKARWWCADGSRGMPMAAALVAIDDAMRNLADTQEATVGRPITDPAALKPGTVVRTRYGVEYTLSHRATPPRDALAAWYYTTGGYEFDETLIRHYTIVSEPDEPGTVTVNADDLRAVLDASTDFMPGENAAFDRLLTALDPPKPCGARLTAGYQPRLTESRCVLTGDHDMHETDNGWMWSA